VIKKARNIILNVDQQQSFTRLSGMLLPFRCLKTLLFLIFITNLSHAQLSPGKLTQSHSKLEGLSNCTQCHSIGDKISNQKCLACHKDLNVRISSRKGFHASSEVRGKDCITCHSDHHGVNFKMVRVDKKTFNHSLTGYELKDGHKTKPKDCNECHKPQNIASATIRARKNTFQGLSTACATCHDDVHQGTLSKDCATCHDFKDFKKPDNFNHNKTDFALRGAHQKVQCNDCHKQEVRNGKKFVKYSGVASNSCTSCHKDEHNGHYGNHCQSCHNDESFARINNNPTFNHKLTGFALEGKHGSVSCKKCHDKTFAGRGKFREFFGKKPLDCKLCHEDIHEGKFGDDCKKCHNQNSFKLKNTKTLSDFDHDNTGFVLKGKHENTDCKSCHKKALTDPVPHKQCLDCHTDKHNGDFAAKKAKYPDCASCHVEDDFMPATFTIEKHNQSDFKLQGSHVATPCISCHKTGKDWKFKIPEQKCNNCHQDIHENAIDKKYYPEKNCETCHTSGSWASISFDHNQTDYPLEGGHQAVNCGNCHFDRSKGLVVQKIKGLDRACNNCHKDVHGGQFAKNGLTDCASCHTFRAWDSIGFDHDKTRFKLDGEHKNVDCYQCHKDFIRGTENVRSFKLGKFKCVDCHL